jgi:hypothetical protein
MKHAVLIGSLAGVILAVSLAAQTKPAPETKQTEPRGEYVSPKAPNQQSTTAPDPAVPGGDSALGSVNVPRSVMANGQKLTAGTYQLRLTAEEAMPGPGQSRNAERWVEFLRGGKVVGREVATIIPDAEVGVVAKGPRPRPNGSRVEMLKGNDYLRIWVNRGSANYLIHLPPAA